MKWYKHETKRKAALKRLIMEYGIEGYGIHHVCMELIAGDLSIDNLTFELDEDAELIAHEFKMDTLKVEKIMHRCIELGLFDLSDNGKIRCFELARLLDESISKNSQVKELKKKISLILDKKDDFNNIPDSFRNDSGVIPDTFGNFPPRREEKRIEEKRIEEKRIEENRIEENIYLIVREAENNYEFSKSFSEFLLHDDNEHRKEVLYWIANNAIKYDSTIDDIHYALKKCYDKDKAGDMSYFTGILRQRTKNKNNGLKPIGKDSLWIAEEYLQKRLSSYIKYIKHYDIDIDNNKLYYSINNYDEEYNPNDLIKHILLELHKDTEIYLEPELKK